MATANDIIKRALRTIGVLATGENPSSEMANDALDALNDVLAGLSNENLTIYAENGIDIPITGQTLYTLGPTGDAVATRPTSIASAYFDDTGGMSHCLGIGDYIQYCAIADKDSTAEIPEKIYFRMGIMPDITMYMHPIPTSGTLKLICRTAIAAFSALTDSVSLPPGYERMLRYALATELMPEYGISNPQVYQTYIDSKADIKRTNTRPALMRVSLPFGVRGLDDIRIG